MKPIQKRKWVHSLVLFAAACVTAVVFQNCSGFDVIPADALSSLSGSQDDSSISPEVPAKLSCDPSTSGTTEKGVRRLSKAELVNSLIALFGETLMNQANVQAALQGVPSQALPTGSFTEYDNRILNIEGLLEVSEILTEQLFKDANAVDRVFGGCRSNTDACIDSLVNKFAYRAWRRPLTASEKAELTTFVKTVGGNEGLKYGLIRVLVSPYFNQHVEIGDQTVSGSRLKLTQFEIAARLAFRLTGTLPTEALLQEAAANRLSTLAQIESQGKTLIQSEAAKKHWIQFFDFWLDGERISNPNALVASEFGISPTDFKLESREELHRFISYIIFEKEGNFQDLYTDTSVFPFTDRLAKVFNVQKSTGRLVSSEGFGGLILRPAKLTTGGVYTNPITRGVYIRERLLCSKLPSPSQDIVNTRLGEVETFSHDQLTTRDIVNSVTSGSRCIGCHSLINPPGFALETFGPLGRPRIFETVYSPTGPSGKTHALNTAVDDLRISSQPTPASGATQMVRQIANSASAKECFSQKLAESTRFRTLSEGDNCVVNDLRSSVHSGRSIQQTILQSVVNEGLLWKSLDGVQQ